MSRLTKLPGKVLPSEICAVPPIEEPKKENWPAVLMVARPAVEKSPKLIKPSLLMVALPAVDLPLNCRSELSEGPV